MKHLLAALVVCCSVAHAQAASLSDSFSSFFVLGDSLSDNGNLPNDAWLLATGGAPYQGGTFTNGAVWNQPIIDQFKAAGKASANFAFGGARATGSPVVPDLSLQIAALQGTTNAATRGPRPLASVWFGANDIFQAFETGTSPLAAAIAAADAMRDGMRALGGLGIKDILTFSLPNLGETPGFALFQPLAAPFATEAADLFNTRMQDHIKTLRGEGLAIRDIDVDALLDAFRTDPGAFGLTDTVLPCVFPNATVAALFGQPERCDGTTAATRLFMDGVHPNAAAHLALSDIVKAQIAPVPLPASLAFLLAGVAAFGAGTFAKKRRA